MKIFIFVLNLFLLINCQKDNSDAYEFGFTIDGQQHRHEKKDVNGIIQGEFGFITADGVYHVTVYATDENGNFRILSMRNIRISAPLDGSPLPKGAKIESYGEQKAPQQPQPNALQITGPPSPAVTTPAARVQNGFTTQPTIKPACGGCGYVTTPKPKPGLFPFDNPPVGSRPASTPGINAGGAATAGPIATPGAGPNVAPAAGPIGTTGAGPSVAPAAGPAANGGTYNNQGGSLPAYQNQPIGPPFGQSESGIPAPSPQQQGSLAPNERQPINPQTYSGQDHSYGQQGQSQPQPQPAGPYTSQPSPQGPAYNQPPVYEGGRQPQAEAVNEAFPNPLSNDNVPEKPRDRISQVSVSNGVIHVPGNPDIPIKDKYPGMKDGLPEGITENDVTDLLYKFNYTVGFHGQYEKGYKNGAKVGGYFVNGRDGLSRVVTYVADENGFRPKVKFLRLGLDSPDTPKEETEKTFGLKHFEFVWYPVK